MAADFVDRKNEAKSVADFANRVLEPVVSRRAAMTVDLVMAWDELAGQEHARYTMPSKIKWPRRAHDDDPFRPGTLIVHCEGPRAVLFQHETTLIVERVNGFFGFTAIESIKIVQKPVQRKQAKEAPPVRLEEADQQQLEKMLTEVADPKLKAGLERLGRGVLGKQRTRSR